MILLLVLPVHLLVHYVVEVSVVGELLLHVQLRLGETLLTLTWSRPFALTASCILAHRSLWLLKRSVFASMIACSPLQAYMLSTVYTCLHQDQAAHLRAARTSAL